MNGYVTADEFVTLSHQFKERMQTANTFEEIREMWRSTSIAYKFAHADPFSPAYRDEVLNLYQNLTQTCYSPQNEMTSTKQSEQDFEVGYPWITKNLEVVAQELGKTVQALRALHARQQNNAKFIEFGAGWGNLAIPLAKAGKDVTAIDIDAAFLNRIEHISRKDNISIKLICGDFLEIANNMHDKYNAVIFQSSFHHCLHFDDLIKAIRSNVLAEGGRIYFFCEPIYKNYTFPWGLRHDGESIWAITCNHWLELGFDWNFFFKLMLRNGLFLSRIEPFPPFVGEGWIGDRGVNGLEFEDWCLPEQYDSTFYPAASTPGFGRFCRESSILPGLRNCYFSSYELQFHNYGVQDLDVSIYFSSYELQFHNYEVQDLDVSIYTDRHPIQVTVPPGGPQSIRIEAACGQVFIKSGTYVPDEVFKNGDTRRLGVALKRVNIC